MYSFKIKREEQKHRIELFVKTHKHKKICFTELGKHLNVSRQNAKLLYVKYVEGTLLTEEHGLVGTVRLDKQRTEYYAQRYLDFCKDVHAQNPEALTTFSYFYDFVLTPKEKEGLGLTSLWNYLTENFIYSPCGSKKVRKRIKAKMRAQKKEGEVKPEIIELQKDFDHQFEGKPLLYRKKSLIPGDIVEADACQHC
ncbi:MAG: hypothetical protein HUK24_07090 [Sphaerochaetaceae bacterium]|nr:hypothetical protein [Sphaerochaetaceae bacterium]